VMQRLPQVLVNVPVRDKAGLEHAAALWAAVEDESARLGSSGRVLVRPSGTESLVRVMCEAATREQCEDACGRLCAVIDQELG